MRYTYKNQVVKTCPYVSPMLKSYQTYIINRYLQTLRFLKTYIANCYLQMLVFQKTALQLVYLTLLFSKQEAHNEHSI